MKQRERKGSLLSLAPRRHARLLSLKVIRVRVNLSGLTLSYYFFLRKGVSSCMT
jgi:hypothetical protein